MYQQNDVWQLVAGYLSGELTQEALQELQQILDKDPVLSDTIKTLFYFFYSGSQEETAQIEEAWQVHVKRMAALK